jgi:amino acid transporter
MVPLMFLTFVLAGVVIVAGFSFGHADVAAAVSARGGGTISAVEASPDGWTFLSASAVLFASFIGFDSIAQAGGEAKNPSRNLPLATASPSGRSACSTCSSPRRCITPCRGSTSRTKRSGAT